MRERDLEREREMERLYDIAARGDVKALRQLLEKDSFLLERVSYTNPNNTPLHIAATKGHLSFVEEILRLDPHLAKELNSQQSSPLHMASAQGHVEIAKKLADVAPNMCLCLDSQGRNPLHLAAVEGHIALLEELLRRAPLAARVKVGRGLTALHLCVEHGQLEALKVLVKEVHEFINCRNDDGDTILHMAVMGKKFETIEYLLSVDAVEVNALNYEGITPLDVLSRSRKDIRDTEIEKSLKKLGGFGTTKKKKKHDSCTRPGRQEAGLSRPYPGWVDNKKSSLMVVASLIATMAFQIGVEPPDGVWRERETRNTTTTLAESQVKLQSASASASLNLSSSPYYHAHDYDAPAPAPSVRNQTYSVGVGYRYRRVSASFFDIPLCVLFYTVNTTAFVASLSIILLLTSGLPLRRGIFMWILMMITWIAIVAIALCYVIVIRVRAKPSREVNSVALVILFTAAVWLLLTVVLVFTHTVRIAKRLVKKIKEFRMRRLRLRKSNSSSSSSTSTGRLPLHHADNSSKLN